MDRKLTEKWSIPPNVLTPGTGLLLWIQWSAKKLSVPTKRIEDALFEWAEIENSVANGYLYVPNTDNPIGWQLLILCYAIGRDAVREEAKRIKPYFMAARASEEESRKRTF